MIGVLLGGASQNKRPLGSLQPLLHPRQEYQVDHKMKPHIVLIPGAYHSGDAYDTFRPYLHNHGYQTTALTLPSMGAEPPLTSLNPEVGYIRGKIVPLLDEGHDVVVVMHSYAGFAGSAALRGLSTAEREAEGQSGGVVSLVYLAAWMLDEGKAIRGSGGASGGKLGSSVMREEVRLFG